jgi:Fe-S cluster assembly protein SufD
MTSTPADSLQLAAGAASVLRPETGPVPAAPHSHGLAAGAAVDVASRATRGRSFDVADFPLPTGREEEWRFTPLDRIERLLADSPSDAHLDWSSELPEGTSLDTVEADDPILRQAPAPADRVAALAHARSGGAVVLRVSPEAAPTSPVVLRLTGKDAEAVVWGHVVVDVGHHAQVTVVIDHSGAGHYAGNLSVLAGDGAAVTLVSVQGWDDDAVHVGQHGIRVGRDARVRHIAVTLGGTLVRLDTHVDYAAPGGDVELVGLYFADAGQHLEHRLFVDHSVPHCRSNVTYKGALQGDDAHTVWVGDVLIRAAAEGTDTYELNRNLVLTDGARADSVPNLEIETGEIVGAGHASATGRFDDEQLFYLMARGIPEAEARRLVVRGFFAELIARIGVPDVEERLLAEIDAELERSLA